MEKEKDSHDFVWEELRENVSSRPTSELEMDNKRKELIRKAIDFDIIDVRSYAGYRGDLLVEFTTLSQKTVLSLKRLAESMGMEVVVKQNAVMLFEVYCISLVEDIYKLKI